MHNEEFRHKSEVRLYLALTRQRGLDWFKGFVYGWKRWPGSQLQKDYFDQLRKGNTGDYGEWK
jgi:hypothetical protein